MKLLRLKSVQEKTGLSKTTIYSYMAKDLFPHQTQLTARCVGWSEAAVDQWIRERVNADVKCANDG